MVLQICLIIAITMAAYFPALNAGFIWDDDRYVTNNPLLTAPDGLRRIWFSLDSPSQYFPLTYTSFRVERALFGLRPFGYHLTNLLLHIANALLLWRLLARLKVPGAWLAAGVFAVHPVQVESVAWITERKNLLMGFFFLLTLLAWVAFLGQQTRHRWRSYTLALVFYGLALFSKATACTLPAALVLIVWLQKKSIDRLRLIQISPFVLMGLLMGWLVTWWERYHQRTQGAEFAIGLQERLSIASHAVWFYAGKLFWPSKLTFSYPRWDIDPTNPLSYGWLVGLIGLFAAIFFARRIVGRGPEVAVAFFIATLSPLLGFVMLYTFRYSFVADHYQYLASIGLIALVAAAFSKVASKYRGGWHLEIASAALLFFLLGGLTWRQTKIYRNIETLWVDTLAKNPDSWLAHNNLGAEFLRKRQLNDAMIHFEKSLTIKPDNAEAQNNLGNVLVQKGQTDDAVSHYRKALEVKPDYASAHNNLGNVFLRRGELDEAIAYYVKALELKPDLAEAHNNLGFAYREKGNFEKAIPHYQKAVALKADYAEAHFNLAEALLHLGRRDEARAQLTEALRINPDYSEARRELEMLGVEGSE
ncbi:MAG: tetratricopeptide repeat protein [Verrucomicrobiota bacterium]